MNLAQFAVCRLTTLFDTVVKTAARIAMPPPLGGLAVPDSAVGWSHSIGVDFVS
jgi:hypothetical protein